jgi:hypothetical protein
LSKYAKNNIRKRIGKKIGLNVRVVEIRGKIRKSEVGFYIEYGDEIAILYNKRPRPELDNVVDYRVSLHS